MQDLHLNLSRASLTTNSSRASRIVRKRDTNVSVTSRNKSKVKEDQCNNSFEEYLSRQSKLFANSNSKQQTGILNQQQSESQVRSKVDKSDKTTSVTSSTKLHSTLSAINLKRNSIIIDRGDRYIAPRAVFTRQSIESSLNDNQEVKDRKRQPTPVKSRKQFVEQNKKQLQKDSSKIFELQLKITGLEQALNKQKKLKQKAETKLVQLANDVKNLRQILSQIQMQNKILQNQKKTSQQRIQALQKTVLQSQTSLSVAQTNLSKLRQSIKQNRLTELQSQIKRLSNNNQKLTETNKKNQQALNSVTEKHKATCKELDQLRKICDLNKQSMKEQYLVGQVERLNGELMVVREQSRGERERFLEGKLAEMEKYIYRMKNHTDGLMVKIHCLQYSKSKQINQLKQKQQSQMKLLRVKYSKMVTQIKKDNLKSSKSKNSTVSTPTGNKNPQPQPLKGRNCYDIESRYCPNSPTPAVNITATGFIQYNGNTGNTGNGRGMLSPVSTNTSVNGADQQAEVRNLDSVGENGSGKVQYRKTSLGSKIIDTVSNGRNRNTDGFLFELSPE